MFGLSGLFKRSQPKPKSSSSRFGRNPFTTQKRSFYSADVDRLLNGWTTSSNSIDFYLRGELTSIRARCKELVRTNPYAKRFITAIKSNVVGPVGITFQAQSKRFVNGEEQLDKVANDAIEAAYQDWADYHADYLGKNSLIDLQNMAITSAAQDGEFIFEIMEGPQYGKYGFQLKLIDSELLDITRNETTSNGGEIRLGVEYSPSGKVIRYHFKIKDEFGNYRSGESRTVNASHILHGFISEWADQSRGVPWMHASLERTKMLDKYDEAAMVAARTGAAKMGFLSSKSGDDYVGDEDDEIDGFTLDSIEAGSIEDIGDREFSSFDTKYPHEMYDTFCKAHLRAIASGIGVSYHSISNDLEGVNYSSIRAGVLEDREIFKGIQDWFIRKFFCPVIIRWLTIAVLNQKIKIGRRPLSRPIEEYHKCRFQARRWAWVDPQKDGQSNNLAIQNRTKSRSQVMREQGDNPDDVWNEIEREEKILTQKGLLEGKENVSKY